MSKIKRSYNLYAAVTPSLEPLLKKELSNILKNVNKRNINNNNSSNNNVSNKNNKNNDNAIIDFKIDKGGIECDELSPEQLWSIVHHSRLSETLRVRLGQPFKALNFNMLKSSLADLPFKNFFKVTEHTLPECSVSCTHSKLYHSEAIKERILEYFQKNVIFQKKLKDLSQQSQTTEPSTSGTAHQSKHSRLFVRLVDDVAQISIDVGDQLHKRTPNKHVTDAPIRETLAAALLASTGYSHEKPFSIWDPFMGSGTILTEAIGIAIGGRCTARSVEREFSFQSWPLHRGDKYSNFLERINQEQSVNQSKVNERLTSDNLVYYGSDIDKRALDATKHNIEQLYGDIKINQRFIQLLQGDFKLVEKEISNRTNGNQKLTIITNLPYGERIMSNNNKDISDGLKATFITFGKMIKESNIIKDVYVLNGNPKFIELTGLNWKSILKFTNGGIPVEFLKLIKNN